MTRFRLFVAAFILLVIGAGIGWIVSLSQRPSFPKTTVIRVSEERPQMVALEQRPETRSIKEAARKITPAVVFIESSVFLESVHQNALPPQPWQRFLPGQRVSTSGSGVLISEDGFILTNHHVVRGAENSRVMVELADRRRVAGVVVGGDPSTDLAVVKIDEAGLPFAALGNSDNVEVGDWVLAVGNPFRLRSTVTAGIVSALGRDVEVINDRLRIEHFIQTDAAINRGNSGGALVDLDGRVIGINTAIASESGAYEGYGFAIPVNLALKVASDIMEHGVVRRGLLGVQIASVSYERARALKLPVVGGVEIISISEQSFAKQAGLKTNDIVIEVNDKVVLAANELQASLALLRPGDSVKLKVFRSGAEVTLNVPLMDAALLAAAEPDAEPKTASDDEGLLEIDTGLGFSITESLNELGTNSELVVTNIKRSSEAFRAGLRNEDRLRVLNGTSVSAIYEWEAGLAAVKKGSTIRIECEKPDGARAFYILRK